ncbi:DsbA family protein [Leptolyngbya sp. FACHB-671]|uniref:DsbA family protein n=1 Tax=Leptolyngbya sp. FACHB-671 TaxID=2692812 RepID=UPI0016899EB5|nr:DsbA family protein [Leptolyngbya sp. FACHB-671]MBD2068018.1 DsbA family protein [Leptolyngbya sp. FACHB-671]
MSYDRDYSPLSVLPSTQDHINGVLNAAIVLVLYGDYQSSQSADVYRLLKVVQQQLSVSFGANYACFIFRHFLQRQIHPQAQHAAEAAEAAAVQGQFWQMHDILFTHSQELGNGYLVEYANRLGLDIYQFLQDLSKQTHADRINQDIEGGLNSGVTTAPALFINGIRYRDRWNMEQLMAVITAVNH